MVFKVAGNAEVLLDAAMLEPDQIQTLADNFSESDLLRYFNCIADTETKLKDATQPRYMLELGLVKLVEMRRLTPVEKILERLAALESSMGKVPLSQAATAEKKTLIPESSEPVPAFSGLPEAEEPFFSEPPPETFEEEPPELEPPAPYDLSFVEELPERPVEISADRLEHYAHSSLDDDFENKLLFAGDLAPLSVAQELRALFSTVKPQAAAASASHGRASSAYRFEPELTEDDIAEIPKLSENPTEDELRAYAEALPVIRKIKRVFRAQIVEVTKAE
jgi:DNA polymerase-3 subunit gamma/tau